MKIQIPMQSQYNNPTALTVAKTLKAGIIPELEYLFQPLKKLGMNAFFYSRFQGLCRVNCLSNHANWLQYLQGHIHTYKQNFETQFHFKPGFSVDLLNIFPKKGMVIEMSEFELNNGIYLSTVSRDKAASEIFLFTTSEKPEISNQKLLENIPSFYQYINYFKEKAASIIKKTQLTKNEIAMFNLAQPKKVLETENKIFLDRYYLGAPYDDIYLNQTEFNYVKEFLLGKSIAEIATHYSVSTKSVNKYLDELTNKLECNNHHELLTQIIYSPLFYPIFFETKNTLLSSRSLSNYSDNIKQENSNLTQRQKDCLFHLAKGMTLKEIAKKLHLAPKTTEHYVNNLKIKFYCKTRAELIAKSIQLLSI